MNPDSNPQSKNLRPFKKGDPRINRSGRPKTFEELRRTADMIASELVPGPDGKMITRGELLLRSWMKSKHPHLQQCFVEYWVGKVPDRIEAEQLHPKTRLILHYGHERVADTLPPPAPNVAGEMQRRLES
jgi:hypothetical protein